jgi:hypothetical protein
MRKLVGGWKNSLAATKKNFSPAHEISRHGLALLKGSVLFNLLQRLQRM